MDVVFWLLYYTTGVFIPPVAFVLGCFMVFTGIGDYATPSLLLAQFVVLPFPIFNLLRSFYIAAKSRGKYWGSKPLARNVSVSIVFYLVACVISVPPFGSDEPGIIYVSAVIASGIATWIWFQLPPGWRTG